MKQIKENEDKPEKKKTMRKIQKDERIKRRMREKQKKL